MHQEIEPAPTPAQRREHGIEALLGSDIGFENEIAVEAFGKRADALSERLPLIGERERRAMGVQCLGDTPAERALVGDTHDEPLLTRHQRHRIPQSSRLRSSYTNRPSGANQGLPDRTPPTPPCLATKTHLRSSR